MAPGNEVTVNLIDEHKDAGFQTDLSQPVQLLAGPDPACGIVRAGEDQHLDPGGRFGLQILIVKGIPSVLPNQRGFHQLPAAPCNHVKQRVVVGHGHQHPVTRLGQDAQHHVHGVDYSRRGEGQILLADSKSVALFQPAKNSIIIGLLPDGIAVDRMGCPLLDRLHHTGGTGEVHIGHPHGDHVLPAKIVGFGVPLIGEGPSPVNRGIKVVLHPVLPYQSDHNPQEH